MPDFKDFEITTTAKTREITATAFNSTSAVKVIEDLMKKVQASPEPQPGRSYFADYLYPSVRLPQSYLTPAWYRPATMLQLPVIENVIFNPPATIVFWGDDTKTIVKCQPGDTFSRETGLAMAIVKKAYRNKGNFNDVFRKWVPRDE